MNFIRDDAKSKSTVSLSSFEIFRKMGLPHFRCIHEKGNEKKQLLRCLAQSRQAAKGESCLEIKTTQFVH